MTKFRRFLIFSAVIITSVISVTYLIKSFTQSDQELSQAVEDLVPALTWVDHTVGQGETLGGIFDAVGVMVGQKHQLIIALREVWNLRSLRIGSRVRFGLDLDGSLNEFEAVISPVEIYQAMLNDDGYIVTKLDVQVETRNERVAVTLDSSLYNAFIDAGEGPALIDSMVDIFAWDIDFYSDPRKGDKIAVYVEKEYVDGEFFRYGRVLAVEYDGVVVKQPAYYYEAADGRGAYFDDKGNSLARNFLKTPVKFTRISSKFGKRRHPVTHLLRQHKGTDYAAPIGAPVWAMADGTVEYRGYSSTAGNYMVLRHRRGYVTKYLHLSRFHSGIKVGKGVKQKDLIGYVGTTGRSTGPHLHLEVVQNGRHIDPLKTKKIKEERLAGAQLAAFRVKISLLVAELKGNGDLYALLTGAMRER